MQQDYLHLGKQAVWELAGASEKGSGPEWLLLGLAVISMILVFARVGQFVDFGRDGPGFSLLAVGVGLIALIAAWVAISGWLPAHAPVRLPGPVARTAAVLVSMVFALPLMCLVLRSRLYGVFWAWTSGLLAAAVLLWLGHLTVDAISAGSQDAQRTKARSEEMQEFLNRQ